MLTINTTQCDSMFSRTLACKECEQNVGKAVERKETSWNAVEIVREITCLGEGVSADGQREAAVTARDRCVWVKLRECGELLYDGRFPLKLKGAVHRRE